MYTTPPGVPSLPVAISTYELHNIAEVYAELAFFKILGILCLDNAAKDRPVCDLKPLDVNPTGIYRCHR